MFTKMTMSKVQGHRELKLFHNHPHISDTVHRRVMIIIEIVISALTFKVMFYPNLVKGQGHRIP